MANPTEIPDTPFQYIDCSSAVLKQEPIEHDEDETTPQQEASDSISHNANISGGDSEFLDPVEEIMIKTEVIDNEDDQMQNDQTEDEEIGDKDIKIKQDKELKNNQGYVIQSGTHREENNLTCPVCDKQLKTNHTFQKHMVLHSAPKYGCETCGKTYFFENNLVAHQLKLKHSGIENKKVQEGYKCEIFDKKVDFKVLFNAHQRIHSDVGQFVSVVLDKPCKPSRIRKKKTADEKVNFFDSPHSCKLCKLTCVTKGNLIRHYISLHSSQQLSSLPEHERKSIEAYQQGMSVSKDYSSMHSSQQLSSLPEHERKSIEADQQANSSQSSSLPERSNVIRHKKGPLDEIYTCEYCYKSYTHKHFFNSHKRFGCHMKPPKKPLDLKEYHKCKICGAKYESKYYLGLHEREHFKCKSCGKSFLRARELAEHERFHIKPKSYSCFMCGKVFYTKINSMVHQKEHLSEQYHFCKVCENSLQKKDNFAHK